MVAHRSRFLPAGGLITAAVLLLSAVIPATAQQITVSNSKSLDFGRFVAGSGGTVAVAPSGLRTRTGGVVLLNSPTAGAAAFLLTKNGGTTSKAVVITLPANGSVSLTSGGNSMPVNNFVSNPATILSLPANGLALTVGATMTVAPNQPAGNYSGSFPLIVNFQ